MGERAEIVQFGSPLASISLSSLSTPPPSSMSYVASCSFSSFSDYNVIKKTKKNDAVFKVNIKTNSSSSNNKNNSSTKNKKKPKGRFPSRFRQLLPMKFKKKDGEKKTEVNSLMVDPILKIPFPPTSYTAANAKA